MVVVGDGGGGGGAWQSAWLGACRHGSHVPSAEQNGRACLHRLRRSCRRAGPAARVPLVRMLDGRHGFLVLRRQAEACYPPCCSKHSMPAQLSAISLPPVMQCSGYEPWFECGSLTGRQCGAACKAAYQQYLQDTTPADVAAGVRLADSCQCSGASRPVCATSGTVYASACRLKCAKAAPRFACGARSSAACAADCLAAVAATASLCAAGTKPVCAMNGKVVSSPCALQVGCGCWVSVCGWVGVGSQMGLDVHAACQPAAVRCKARPLCSPGSDPLKQVRLSV